MKMIIIVSARPQFIKAAAISSIILDDYADNIQKVLVHTEQHFDESMTKFFPINSIWLN